MKSVPAVYIVDEVREIVVELELLDRAIKSVVQHRMTRNFNDAHKMPYSEGAMCLLEHREELLIKRLDEIWEKTIGKP